MLGRVRTVWLAIGVVCMAALGAGCEGVYPQPSEDAVLQFIRNARFDGRLRVCWPAGQEYVLGIMKADAELRQALAAQLTVADIKDLRPQDDPQWQKEYAPKENEMPATATTEPSVPSLDALGKAIDQLPAGLKLDTPEAQAAFKSRVWDALAVDGVPLQQHIEQARALGELTRRFKARIAACNGLLDKDAPGLRFTDEACQRDMEALYAELAATLSARHDRFLQYAAEQMEYVRAHIEQVDKQKQRNEYLLLDNTREYFKRTLREGWLDALGDRVRKMQRELTDHESGRKPLDSVQLEFVHRELPRLKERHAALEKRVDVIVPPTHGQ